MLTRKEFVEEGDWIILYESFNNVKTIQVKKGEIFQNRNGNFKHTSFIGARYGSRVSGFAAPGKHVGTILILHPNPQLWTDVLSHRTQILFQMDISLVLYHLDIRPGSVVIESGTGSGSLTTSFARAVAPHGHVHSFEFNADRVQKANVDFKNNQIDHLITVRHRDVCELGFPFFPEGVDAVFLDLPKPWVTIDDAHRSLRPQGKFCSFSPCIEQVQRSCLRLAELKYEDIITIECLLKPYEAATSNKVLNIFELAANADAKAVERKNYLETKAGKSGDDEADVEPKKSKTEADTVVEDPVVALDTPITPAVTASSTTVTPSEAVNYLKRFADFPNSAYMTKPLGTMRGHTGYLTFARKPCSIPVDAQTESDAVKSD